MNEFLNAGIKRTVDMKEARDTPTEACSGWPSLLKINAPDTTRPARVKPEMRIELV